MDELIRSTDEVGMTPLLWSAKRGFADVVEVLLAFGADAAAVIEAEDAARRAATEATLYIEEDTPPDACGAVASLWLFYARLNDLKMRAGPQEATMLGGTAPMLATMPGARGRQCRGEGATMLGRGGDNAGARWRRCWRPGSRGR